MYHHVSLAEREELYALLKAGWSLGSIAKKLHRSKGTLSRELKRNQVLRRGLEKTSGIYLPCKAQEKAVKRAVKQRSQASWKGPEVLLYVSEKLKEGWSPETIAGRIERDHKGLSIVPETIYQMIYEKQNKKFKLWQYLALSRKKRMKKNGRRVHREGRIPEAVSIDLRPVEVLLRTTPGHWETDNLIGKQTDKSALSVSVERKLRLTMLSLVKKTADGKLKGVFKRFSILPEILTQTVTLDNGKENTNHKEISQNLGMAVYFCHAYHSWEKGSVENMNMRIRRFIPKGMSLDAIDKQTIARIEWKLNNTPRKCLSWKTPLESLQEMLQNTNYFSRCTSG